MSTIAIARELGSGKPLLWKGVVVYVDDLFIYSKTVEEHERLVKQVLSILHAYDLRIKLAKLQLFHEELEILGHVVRQGKWEMDPKRAAAVRFFPKPTTLLELKRFEGVVAWNSRHVRQAAQ